MASTAGKTTDNAVTINAEQINANVANFTYLNVQQNTVLNNLSVTGTCNIPGGFLSNYINCATLTASSFVKAKNDVSEYALLQTTASTEAEPNQCILSSSEGSQGLDIITLGGGKKIHLISDECHMVAGYEEFPVLPGGIALFSDTLITLDALAGIELRAATDVSVTSITDLSLSGGTTTDVTSQQALTLTGGTTASLTATNQSLTLSGKTSASLTAIDQGLTLSGKSSAALSATNGGLSLTGQTTASLTSTTGAMTFTAGSSATLTSASLSLTGASTASLIATSGALTLSGGAAASLTAGAALTLEGIGEASLTAGAALTLGAAGIATLSSLIDVELTALAGRVKVRSVDTDISSNIVTIGATVGNVSIGSTAGAIELTTGAGAIALTTGIGGMSLAVVGGAITMSTTLGQVSLGTVAGGSLKLFSGNNVQILSNAGDSTGGIYLNTSASNGVSQAYQWRFPSGPGTSGQVLTSGGSSSAQTWSTVLAADANNNISANNFFSSTTTTSSNTTVTMTAASPYYRYVTASGGTVIFLLPNATTLPNGAQFYFNCNGTSTVSIRRSDNTVLRSFAQGSYTVFTLLSNATAAGTWDHHSSVPANVNFNSTAISGPQTFNTTSTELANGYAQPVTASILTQGGMGAQNCWLTSDLVLQNGSNNTNFVSLRSANASYGPYNLYLPTGPGNAGQVLTSAGNTGSPMYWSTPGGGGGGGISSVGMVVPPFLSVSPGNITTTGTFTVTYSGTALPVANGGTGVTTSTGSGANVLATAPAITSPILTTVQLNQGASQQAALVYPTTNNGESSIFFLSQTTNTGGRWSIGHNIGGGADTFSIYSTTAAASIILLSPTLATFNTKMTCSNTTVAGAGVNNASIYSAGGISARNAFLREDLVLEYTAGSFVSIRPFQGVHTPYNFILPSSEGTLGQVLQSNGPGQAMSWASGSTGSVVSVGMTVPSFMSVSPATITTSGTFAITAASTGTGSVVLATSPTLSGTTLQGITNFNSIIAGNNFNVVNTVNASVVNIASFTAPNISGGFIVQNTLAGANVTESFTVRYIRGGSSKSTFYQNNTIFLEASTSLVSIPLKIANDVPGNATVDTNFFCPLLANANSFNFNFGASATSNNCGVIQFVNSGGSGSALNSVNIGVFGVNSITIKPADTSFLTPCIFPSVKTPTIICNDSLTIRANTNANDTIFMGVGGYQTGGLYLNAQRTPIYSALPVKERGSTNIGNDDLGNCLFVAANQDKYIGRISANGIVNICSTQTNGQFLTFYEAYRGLPNPERGLPFQAVGSIALTVTGGTVYSTTSDYRLKENIEEMPSMISLISTLRPVVYNFKADTSATINHGFIAHEVETLFPEAVTGEKDAVDEYGNVLPQQLSYASFTPLLTKAMQELIVLAQQQQQTIESLSQRITLLESAQ